jgi:integrase
MKIRVFKRPGSDVYQMDVRVGMKRFRKSAGTANERVADKVARQWAENLAKILSARGTEIKLVMAVDLFVAHCRRLKRAKLTIDGYRSRLKHFVGWTGDVDLREWTPDVARTKVDEYLTDRENAVKSVDHDRIALSVFFNFLKSKNFYAGENPANAKLHVHRKQPNTARSKPKRCTTDSEDKVIRCEGAKIRLWPVILLTRWAGMRRGEACRLRWSEVNLEEGFADIVGHEGGRKHPRRVWLAPWVVLQIRALRPTWLPADGNWPVWPYHPDVATKELADFTQEHLGRKVSFNALRASFTTDCFECGLSPVQESRIVGHSVSVAERHYSEYQAKDARGKLPPDPLDGRQEAEADAGQDTDLGARKAQ